MRILFARKQRFVMLQTGLAFSRQRQRHAKNEQDIGHQEEDELLYGQVDDEDVERLRRVDGPGAGLDSQGVGKGQIEGGQYNTHQHQFAIMPQDVEAEDQLCHDGQERPGEQQRQVGTRLPAENENADHDCPDNGCYAGDNEA